VFSDHAGPLVIFGQSLEDQFDRHLILAIKSGSKRPLGIGIHPTASAQTIAEQKAKWYAKFPGFDLSFFDSTTHPLGLPELKAE
jgi:hypothetical protein